MPVTNSRDRLQSRLQARTLRLNATLSVTFDDDNPAAQILPKHVTKPR